ncbi:MAG: YggT family protein [Chitinivibrionales bacterium]|nr:YggT family protein [Chitinivibrionales bacterium]
MTLILFLIRLYEIILIIRIVMSWMQVDPYHSVTRFVYNVTEPVLEPIRRVLPANRIGIDFSPLVVFILIAILRRILFPPAYF